MQRNGLSLHWSSCPMETASEGNMLRVFARVMLSTTLPTEMCTRGSLGRTACRAVVSTPLPTGANMRARYVPAHALNGVRSAGIVHHMFQRRMLHTSCYTVYLPCKAALQQAGFMSCTMSCETCGSWHQPQSFHLAFWALPCMCLARASLWI